MIFDLPAALEIFDSAVRGDYDRFLDALDEFGNRRMDTGYDKGYKSAIDHFKILCEDEGKGK